MKLAVITAGFYPSRSLDENIKRLQYSCDVFGIQLQPFGKYEHFNFFDSKIVKMGRFLDQLKNDYTHVLYTDASDSFFLAGLDEILQKYEWFPAQLVVAGEKGCHPFGDLAEQFPPAPTPYRFMNPGNFIGEIPVVLDVLSKLQAFYMLKTNDQGHWVEGYLQKKFNCAIDYECHLFQTMSDCEFDQEFVFENGRLRNKVTGNYPCIVHFNGPKGGDYPNQKYMEQTFAQFTSFHEKK